VDPIHEVPKSRTGLPAPIPSQDGAPGSAFSAPPGAPAGGSAPPASGGFNIGGFKDVFRNSDFRRLFWGQGVSAIGDWVGTLAFIVAARRLAPGNPEAVALVLILRLLPTFLATPVGGVLSDRWDRKRIMIASDLARFVVICAVPFLPHIGYLYLLAFVQESLSLVFLPARDAAVPSIVGADHLEAANALVMGSSFAGIPLSGPIFAGAAFAGAHFPHALPTEHIWHSRPYAFPFLFDGLTFVVSALMIRGMRWVPETHRPEVAAEPFFASMRHGVRYILDRPFIRGLAYAVSVGMLGGGVLFALGIGYVHDTLGGGDVEFGWLMGIFGAGMVFGFLVSQLHPPGGIAWMIRVSLFVMGAVIAFMGVFPVLWIGYLMALVFGVSFSVSLIVAMSAVQARTEDDYRGRVMGAVHMIVRGALSIGALASAAVAALFPARGLSLWRFHPDKNQFALVIAGALIAAGTLGVRAHAEERA
jgi:dTMP kinase